MESSLVDADWSSRELVRNLRAIPTEDGVLPESVAWQTYVELRRRGEPDADGVELFFLGDLLEQIEQCFHSKIS